MYAALHTKQSNMDEVFAVKTTIKHSNYLPLQGSPELPQLFYRMYFSKTQVNANIFVQNSKIFKWI